MLLLPFLIIPAWFVQRAASVEYENLPGVARYSSDYLLSWDSHYTQVTVYRRDGKAVFSAPERKDDSSAVTLAVDSDGTVAEAYHVPQVAEGRIDLLDLSGRVTGSIDTGSYVAQQIAFAPDHSVWTAGYMANSDGTRDFKVLRHYARTGEELGEALRWSEIGFDLKHPVVESIRGGQLLYVSKDRVGWNTACRPGPRLWVEVSFAGVVLGKYDLKTGDGLSLFTEAMTANGNVYAKIFKPRSARFAILDRSKGMWEEVSGDPGGVLIGSDGDDLVFATRESDRTLLTFTPSRLLHAQGTQQ